MRLIIVRHGQTAANIKRLLQSAHEPLNTTGQQQATLAGKRLKKEKIDVAYVSPMARARATAANILAEHPEVEEILNNDLRERDMGSFEGLLIEDYVQAAEKSGQTHRDFKPEGGETLNEVLSRAERFVAKLQEDHGDETVLIVSHGLLIRMLHIHFHEEEISEETWKRFHPKNTAVSIIELKDKKHDVILLNCTKHLEGSNAH